MILFIFLPCSAGTVSINDNILHICIYVEHLNILSSQKKILPSYCVSLMGCDGRGWTAGLKQHPKLQRVFWLKQTSFPMYDLNCMC